MPGLDAAEPKEQAREKKLELHRSTDARKAGSCTHQQVDVAYHLGAALFVICQTLLAHKIADFVHHLKFRTNGTIDMKIHGQCESSQPSLLPSA
mmetsp:Transcript_59529/g.82677  ORF Transcript_59529/g.82677 Transcript_59529/m.82677 type:complete len:94 (-) Transcript_59529:452-733(-)